MAQHSRLSHENIVKSKVVVHYERRFWACGVFGWRPNTEIAFKTNATCYELTNKSDIKVERDPQVEISKP